MYARYIIICNSECVYGSDIPACIDISACHVMSRIDFCVTHHVFCDNFFTNKQLLQDLLDDGILACGTDRKGLPPALKQVKLKNRYACSTSVMCGLIIAFE